MPEEILRRLSDHEVAELFQLYRQRYGERNFHYLLMYNQLKWDAQLVSLDESEHADPAKWVSFRKTFYTHRDCDFRQHGTYVSLHWDLMQSVSFHSWEPDLKELFECLRRTQLIDWQRGPLLTNVDMHYCKAIKEIAAERGASVQRARKCWGLVLPHDTALSIDLAQHALPPGYRLRPLNHDDAAIVHETWVNKKEGSLQYIRGLIQLNKTLGVVRDTDDELIAWIFQNDFSGLGILQVQPEVQRQGIGGALAAQMSSHIARSEQVDLSAWILCENFKSGALLRKVGYEKTVMNEWIQLRGPS